jgi:multimeric flavodoxin WrbA
MKVLLVNGSPNENGCTNTALEEIAKSLNENDIETQIFHIGTKPISGCLDCGMCRKLGKCFIDDTVNEFVKCAKDADGFVFGSPVHYASASGMMTSFLDRVFFSGGKYLKYKPATNIVSARRGGTTAAFDQLNKYLTINNMPVVSSQYWNMVHGNTSEEVKCDLEGMQTMRILGNNMAWLLKCIKIGKENGIDIPKTEQRIATNFIR